MAASKPSPIQATGLGPMKKAGVVPTKVHRVRPSRGPTSPRSTPMPSFGPSYGQKVDRGNILPKVKGSGGSRRVGRAG